MSSYNLTKMTWEEVKEALETVELAIIPVGAHEQHGPHMNESCDAVLAERMAEKLGEKMFPYAFITPTVNMGVSPHHLNFPGTISLQPETLIAILRDIVSSLKRHGINKFLCLNSHGGNISTLSTASTILSQELEVEVYYAKTTASAKEAISTHVTSSLFGHSCEREVSEALYLAPELVRIDKLTKGDIQEGGRWRSLRPGRAIQGFYRYEEMTQNGCIGNATQASREIGEQIVEEALGNLARDLYDLLELKVKS
ncbi:creatininase family protein [Bacillus thermotolerans]|uniref:Creatinine amidohydrolase n=1 Tax=Bacillus thermotolerans TaxID=1221996 RepID=A0A0F5HUB8_BACTR|nr:creatininase family protein [Bacillus thermotolerans]KKB36620.1 Creatinine amidohydrolase [Bacillus thermotolerans]KKB40628.1 Creatinine amidohydrolase [Bacillus thermotolerans]KKB41289.1 Creatinine amidohydrolase [Bacillus thermotolerans]